ncbi:MAG: hypothetical protein DCC55_24850 [Chloroflexi bacterium]|nr:MAG: hypothetical protein DCC55_24850 [Chloroflexota bacterium]
MSSFKKMTHITLRTAGIWIVARHILLECLVDGDTWGVPGGKLELDETAEEGCLREYREELGLEMQCIRLAVLHENFYAGAYGRVREHCFYFLVQPKHGTVHAPMPVVSREPQLRFAWFPLDDLAGLKFVPAALKPVLPDLGSGTQFLSTVE